MTQYRLRLLDLQRYYNNRNPSRIKAGSKKVGYWHQCSWAFAWPLNRRIIYNRCSADPQGKPWNPDPSDVGRRKLAGNRCIDFNANVPPEATYKVLHYAAQLQARLCERHGKSFPEHYEPAKVRFATYFQHRAV